MGRGTCGAEEQDQMGDTDRCPLGWPASVVPGLDRVGKLARDPHSRRVAGTASWCELCGANFGKGLTEGQRKSFEGLAVSS